MINVYELRTGRVQMADLIRDASYEMHVKQIQYIQQVLNAAASSWTAPFYATGSGIVKTALNPQIQHWMRTGVVTLLGDIAIVSKLADQTGFTAATSTQQFSPSIIDEVIRTGVIGVYYGAKVVNLVNPYLSDNVTPVIDTKRLYILPSAASADMRPLKVLYEGDVQSTESTNIDDLAYEVRLDQWFGAGVVTGKTPAMSVYTWTARTDDNDKDGRRRRPPPGEVRTWTRRGFTTSASTASALFYKMAWNIQLSPVALHC